IYQIVWLEQLALALGSSAASLGVLLATFLGGLGAGSLLATRMPAAQRPLRRYALLELLTAALGLATLITIPMLGRLYVAWAGDLGFALRLVVAALALLPATMLMGATLPVVAAQVGTGARGAARLGWLYSANTAGGVLGALVAAFWLLRVHDSHVATYVAVALNLGVAAAAALLARWHAPARSIAAERPASAPRTRGVSAIYAASGLSGMTALA